MSPALAAILDPQRLMPQPDEDRYVSARIAAAGAAKARALRAALERLGAGEKVVSVERRRNLHEK